MENGSAVTAATTQSSGSFIDSNGGRELPLSLTGHGMPMLSKSGKTAETCFICPVMKRRVLKKILEGCGVNF